MSPERCGELLERICDLWPGRLELNADRWAERLADVDYLAAVAAVNELSDEGIVRRPTVGQVRKRVFEAAPAPRRRHEDVACSCWETGLTGCEAKHDAGWRTRQADRDQAADIVDEAMRNGELVNPRRYRETPYLEQAVEARLAQWWYAQNAAAGRAINDPGDAHGGPTKPPARNRWPVPGADERRVGAVATGVMEGSRS